jgi:hypothetical protein
MKKRERERERGGEGEGREEKDSERPGGVSRGRGREGRRPGQDEGGASLPVKKARCSGYVRVWPLSA